jgi:hypothetical protein
MKDQKKERKFTLVATWIALASLALAVAAHCPAWAIVALHAAAGAAGFLLYANLALFRSRCFFMSAILAIAMCFGLLSLIYLCTVNAAEAALLREQVRTAG